MTTVTLENKAWRWALLPELGCHWQDLSLLRGARAIPLLIPPAKKPLAEQLTSFGCYLLAPWANRLPATGFPFEGRQYPLRPNWDDGTAIHGDVRTRAWTVESAAADRAVFSLDARAVPEFNFTFPFLYRFEAALTGPSLRAQLTLTNVGATNAPAAAGFHPFFRRQLSSDFDDTLVLTLPAKGVYAGDGPWPTPPMNGVNGRTDFRGGKAVTQPMDDCFRLENGRPWTLRYPASRVSVTLTPDVGLGHAFFYSPKDMRAFTEPFAAVEPMSCVNNGFNFLAQGWADTGVAILKPGEAWTVGFTLAADPA
jgi:aldose 1-epimerase